MLWCWFLFILLFFFDFSHCQVNCISGIKKFLIEQRRKIKVIFNTITTSKKSCVPKCFIFFGQHCPFKFLKDHCLRTIFRCRKRLSKTKTNIRLFTLDVYVKVNIIFCFRLLLHWIRWFRHAVCVHLKMLCCLARCFKLNDFTFSLLLLLLFVIVFLFYFCSQFFFSHMRI